MLSLSRTDADEVFNVDGLRLIDGDDVEGIDNVDGSNNVNGINKVKGIDDDANGINNVSSSSNVKVIDDNVNGTSDVNGVDGGRFFSKRPTLSKSKSLSLTLEETRPKAALPGNHHRFEFL